MPSHQAAHHLPGVRDWQSLALQFYHRNDISCEYLKELRLNQALILLKNSDYGIATIAAKVGYHNPGHFAKLFKKVYGLGPREYRNLHGIK